MSRQPAIDALPEGFIYHEDFLTQDEEATILEGIRSLEFGTFQMHGVTAKRRVAHFGWSYGYESATIKPGTPLPDFLLPLRRWAAGLIDAEPEELAEVLVTEYSPGAGIGWHRDAPMFGKVVGVSLGGDCVFKLREGPGQAAINLALPPRSAYVIDGAARNRWQHSIPGVKTTRYSVTFRTLRRLADRATVSRSSAAKPDSSATPQTT